MESNYDEDLYDNIFFQVLTSDHYDLFTKAIHDGWLICVPRAGSLPKCALTQKDMLSHILIPSDELPETHFRSLNDKSVKIFNRVVTVESHDNSTPFNTSVMFEETFYDSDMLKYKVLCVEHSLETHSETSIDSETTVSTIQTLRDCIDLLWIETAGKGVLEEIDNVIKKFLTDNDRLEYNLLQTQRDLVSQLYTDCLQITLQDTRLKSKTNSDKFLFQNIKVSVESYMHHAIYKKLIKGITACTASDDACFNKIVRNLNDLQLKDLDVRLDLYDTVSKAKAQLARVDGYCTVLGKIGCLQRTISAISKCDSTSQGNVVTADDLIPIIIFLVIKTGLPNWIAHLTYMKSFNFTTASSQCDQNSFLVTSLEAAIEHIKSGSLLNPAEPESQIDYENSKDTTKISNNNNLEVDCNVATVDPKKTSLLNVFDLARQGKDIELKTVLENCDLDKERVILENDLNFRLCHPLCSCDDCERLICQNLCNMSPTVNSCDDRGFTILHVGCMYGKPKVVDVLLALGSNPDAADYSGSTPLHYAALRGHQNALLLLIHNGANVDPVNNEGNTPLHLSTVNGHEDCIKALLYFTEHIGIKIDVNRKNLRGETPLHNASRWGYESIVKILLDYGANPTIENKRKLTPIDYAHNLHISHILTLYTKKNFINTKINKIIDLKNHVVAAATTKKLDFNDECKNLAPEVTNSEFGLRPQTTDQIRHVERLLRAITFGDIRLACFYLGLNLPSTQSEAMEKSHSCHPLCSCPKLIKDLADSDNEDKKFVFEEENININVCDSEGFTPLHVAIYYGQFDLAEMLIRAGASINLRTRNKYKTALHIACENRSLQMSELLLETNRCDIDLQDSLGNTALHYACLANYVKLVRLLLKYKPNLNIKNTAGKTALKEAEDKMSLSLVRLLSNYENTVTSLP